MNAVVTGGARGIGRAIVEELVSRGDTVFIFDCSPPEDNLGASFIQVDISSLESIREGFEKINGPIDILVNNAGIARDMLAVRLREADWDAVLDVNLKGAFFCAQQALKRMMKQKKSYIINISSVVGVVGNPGQINYAASKAGLIAVTKTLAKEYAARNVLVNAIAPGFIQTSMTEKLSDKVKQEALTHIPLNRFGTPQDVAKVVSFLTSGNADYLTGQVLHVDGGMVV
ncbi:3-oxoacyl-ACP reductase FabG [Candidatus Dependentiae bacterium]|nr:3-oxoacyl-ACP reductase FabG [Candidatus Dependentiae bacterium]